MADIDFEVISPSAAQSGDAFVTRRGGGAPYSGALVLTADMLARANHTGTQAISTVTGLQTELDGKAATSHTHTASEITDFDTEVANNAAVAANTAKDTNATHTGDVTGATALTIDPTAITGKSAVTADATDYVLISDTSDSGNLKKALVSDFGGSGGGITYGTATTISGTPSEVELDSIPTTAVRVTLLFNGLSFDGNDSLFIQLGNSSTYATSGYLGSCLHWAHTAQSSTLHAEGFAVTIGLGTRKAFGHITFVKIADGEWTMEGGFSFDVSNAGTHVSGYVPGVGTLSRLKLYGSLGGVFDEGTVRIMWE